MDVAVGAEALTNTKAGPLPIRRDLIGPRLLAARIRLDLSTIQLAQRTGIPTVEITAIEAGTRPTDTNLFEICRVLKVRLSSLFREDD